jgi:hypothetical protein
MDIIESIWPIILIEFQLLTLIGWDYAVEYYKDKELERYKYESIRRSIKVQKIFKK